MEHTIGNLTSQIHQPFKPYANLSQRWLCVAQVNALVAMLSELDTREKPLLPCHSLYEGDGYVLLPVTDNAARSVSSREAIAL